VSAQLPEPGPGHPDWEQAIKDAQAQLPAVDSPALSAQAARRAETAAKFSAAWHRED
jgi:hypothetical protein